MIAANSPVQRPPDARLLAVDAAGSTSHWRRSEFVKLIRPGDLVVANDAATIPASLSGTHIPSGQAVEVRLAGRASLETWDVKRFSAVVFGAGDFRERTEDRPLPPALAAGDLLALGPLRAAITGILRQPRFVQVDFDGRPNEIWEGIARHGRPIQYSHLPSPLALWDTWTPIAGPPVAFEPPSAGFILDWDGLRAMAARGIRFATVTHSAGISSTGDAGLDALLPLDEPYRIPISTARAIRETRRRGGRIIAIGTSVVRALEHAGSIDGTVHSGDGLATQRLGPGSRLCIVDALISGTHEPGTSHYELLQAFVDDVTLARMDGELEAAGYKTHEYGDSVFVESSRLASLPHREAPMAFCA